MSSQTSCASKYRPPLKKFIPASKESCITVECKLLKKQREKTETGKQKPAIIRTRPTPHKPFFSDIDLSILFACKGVTPGYSTYMGWRKLRSPGFWNTHSSKTIF